MLRRKRAQGKFWSLGLFLLAAVVLGLILPLAYRRSAPPAPATEQKEQASPQETAAAPSTPEPTLEKAAQRPSTVTPQALLPSPAAYVGTPTPDPTRIKQPDPARTQVYIVRNGDTVSAIARAYGSTITEIVTLNHIDPNAISPGQKLLIPVGASEIGPASKLVPDSETVYGPAYAHFPLADFVAQKGGYLVHYREEVEGRTQTGTEIVQLVAQRYSLGPRVLLALLELESGWVTNPNPPTPTVAYPMGSYDKYRTGLFRQLSWAASELNSGYYGWKYGDWTTLSLADGSRMALAPGLNAGTVAIQNYLAHVSSGAQWRRLAGPEGFAATYARLFGNPFAYGVEPLFPPNLKQPELRLPWEEGQMWYLTSGPHEGWGVGSAWAALDFVTSERLGCQPSPSWVTASADGLVLRSDYGEVVVDLDRDGHEETGWVLTYMHIYEDERVPVGTQLKRGERIGHPSCEGGVADASHLHLARRYNGEWVPAGRDPVPMVLSGWTAQEATYEYDGTMSKGDLVREACECTKEELNGLLAQ